MTTFTAYGFSLKVAANQAFFLNSNNLWCTDGTPENTKVLKSFESATLIGSLGNKIFFYASEPESTTGKELWVSDGTADGTVLVKDICSGEGDSFPPTYSSSSIVPCCSASGTFYFVANDGVNGEEIWRTDGTSDGTQLHCETIAGPESEWIREMVWSGDQIFLNLNSELMAYPAKPPDDTFQMTIPGWLSSPNVAIFGSTGVAIEFISNRWDDVLTVNRFSTAPPMLDRRHLPVCWEILGMEGCEFSAILSFTYTDAELAQAGFNEHVITLLRSEDGGVTWEDVPSVVNAATNIISTRDPQDHFSLWDGGAEFSAVKTQVWEQY